MREEYLGTLCSVKFFKLSCATGSRGGGYVLYPSLSARSKKIVNKVNIVDFSTQKQSARSPSLFDMFMAHKKINHVQKSFFACVHIDVFLKKFNRFLKKIKMKHAVVVLAVKILRVNAF